MAQEVFARREYTLRFMISNVTNIRIIPSGAAPSSGIGRTVAGVPVVGGAPTINP